MGAGEHPDKPKQIAEGQIKSEEDVNVHNSPLVMLACQDSNPSISLQ